MLADTPGHVQYTRNTVTGASTAQLAILLVDARKGVIEQTRRHAAVIALLGVPQLVLAVNKIDLVDFDEATFRRSPTSSPAYAAGARLSRRRRHGDPGVGAAGDNVVDRSDAHALVRRARRCSSTSSRCRSGRDARRRPFRFPVQYVIRPRTAEHPDYRGYAGRVAAGRSRVGDEVTVLPVGQAQHGRAASTRSTGRCRGARAGQSVTLRLADDVDIARGDVIAAARPPRAGHGPRRHRLLARREAQRPGARLLVQHGTRTVQAIVGEVTPRLDVDTLTVDEDPGELGINDMGQVSVTVSEPLPVDDYDVVAATGSFLLVDPQAGDTLGAGLVGPTAPRGPARPGLTTTGWYRSPAQRAIPASHRRISSLRRVSRSRRRGRSRAPNPCS